MTKQVQIRRGTTSDLSSVTGAEGELMMDTTTKQLRIYDGETLGGAGVIDPVVAFQRPTAENNYTWFRLYASGWVEQGGRAAKGQTNITLPVEMADTNYFVYKTLDYGTGTVDWTEANNSQSNGIVKTTTGFVCGTRNGDWEVKGMAA
jgi:hypothetical protein